MKILYTAFLLSITAWLMPGTLTADDNASLSTLIQRSLQSEVMHRGWQTKSYGDRTPHDFITVITTPDLNGDLIILRWNSERTQFRTEVYHHEEGPGAVKSWVLDNSSIEKSVVQQPGGVLHVFERVSGPQGGQQVEVIKLGEQ